MLALLGIITQIRVFNAGMDDLAYVIGMNRLRGAYLDLDPELDRYLIASPNDDELGVARTYYPFASRPSQVPASTMMIISLVCSVVVGLATASLAVALAAPVWVCVIAGLVAGSGHLVGSVLIGNRTYRNAYRMHRPLRPTPGRTPADPL